MSAFIPKIVSVVAFAAAFAASGAAVADGANDSPVAPAFSVDTCDFNFAAANGLTVCTTADGNVLKINVNGAEHVRNGGFVEGYEICSGSSLIAFDGGGYIGESGFTDVSTAFTGSKVTVVRDAFPVRLKQEITRSGAQRSVTVKVTLTNRSGTAVTGLRFGRFVDADVDTNLTGSFANDWVTSSRTAEAFRSFTAEAGTLKLTNQTMSVISPSIGAFAGETDGSCVDGTGASGATGADLDMKLIWSVPTINPGRSVGTTFVYYAN